MALIDVFTSLKSGDDVIVFANCSDPEFLNSGAEVAYGSLLIMHLKVHEIIKPQLTEPAPEL